MRPFLICYIDVVTDKGMEFPCKVNVKYFVLTQQSC